jgi:aryl-alcohol dehydrogenase-like predicted oxidoreductase
MEQRPLGHTSLSVSHIGWGTVKIGRNTSVKFPEAFELPSEEEAIAIVHGMIDLGITLIDTAPAYGLAESRLGSALAGRRDDVVLCTKVGETFTAGQSQHDFSGAAARASLHESLRRLRTDHVDVVLVHSDGRDLSIQQETDLVETLEDLRQQGLTRAIGFSGKTPEGARAAMDWADVLMCQYTIEDRSHEAVMIEAAEGDIGLLLKKVLGSGHLEPAAALRFVLRDSPIAPLVSSAVIGSLSVERMRVNTGAI